jgi:class 3 adenylate cyclase
VRHASEIDRVLATVLVAQVAEEAVADQSAPDAYRNDRIARHQSFVKKEIELFKGRLVEFSDGRLMATFDGPARAIRAACAIRASAQRLGLKLQAGLHTGECDVLGDHVSGIAVEIAAQVATLAAASEVLVSSTVKDLVAGSGISFVENGSFALKDKLGEWRLFAIDRKSATI